MAIYLHCAGTRFELNDRLDVIDVRDRTRRFADIARFEATDPAFRLYDHPDATGMHGTHAEIDPWVTFGLANGSELSIWIYDAVNVAIESTDTVADVLDALGGGPDN